MIRVVVVEDETLVREGLVAILSGAEDIDVVGTAGDGREALDVVAASRPDIVLMDLRMPVLDGIATTERLTAAPDSPAVLVLTTVETDEAVADAFRAGARGFVLKSSPRVELWNAVRTVAGGGMVLAPNITRRLVEQRLASSRSAVPAMHLTERQAEVVRLVARGLSNSEVARALHLAETTVKGYVSEVLNRHGLRDRTQLVVVAYESGLVVPGEGTERR
ncbi:DNA-binding response regulator [Nocardioides immobilis]|uniref:DNA-binding response regulator n=1 Tax=Nocardioides immobilis TaxID=2049295 RepID=A0A417XUF2_9ACTN|nr:response regulator transcription factor [Nocardioides immobilis]RHW24134.1 DNA-binding response regulator [Nocardioides immobilis]